jgi:hypothetical protein
MTHRFNFYRTANLVLIAGLLTLSSGLASAQSKHCLVLRGAYAFTQSGTAVFPGNSTPIPFYSVGIFTFDETGKWTQVSSSNFNGSIARSVPGSGTYTLKPDCSGTMTTVFPDGSIHFVDFALSKRGKTFYAIGVADYGRGNMTTVVATRID